MTMTREITMSDGRTLKHSTKDVNCGDYVELNAHMLDNKV